MKLKMLIGVGVVAAALVKFAVFPDAQGADVKADYDRANSLTNRVSNKIYNSINDGPNWVQGTQKFWYRKTAKGGANAASFVLVDPAVPSKVPAFDHARLATALSTAAGASYTAVTLPFTTFTYADNMQAIDFTIGGGGGGGRAGGGGGGRGAGAAAAGAGQPAAPRWHCTLTDYTCTRSTAPAETVAGGLGAGQGRAGGGGGGGGRGGGCAPVPGVQAGGGGRAGGGAGGGRAGGGANAEEAPTCRSFDGKYEAFIQNYNVFIRPVAQPAAAAAGDATPPNAALGAAGGGRRGPQPVALSWDGSEGDAYTFNSIAWSPDSKHIAAYRRLPGYNRLVTYVQSSPSDQLQPKTSTMFYRKPGDVVDLDKPALFDVDSKQQHIIDRSLFPNAYQISGVQWRRDSRAFTFNYNQRGHQVYRVIEVDAATAKARALIEETSKTFINYSNLTNSLGSAGRMSKSEINDGKEIIWMSERDGWAHLYLYDGVTGQVKNQITKGPWVVRSVERVDEQARQIYFTAGGMNPDQDPYFLHYYRINFDGTGLVKYTDANGYHNLTWSPDRQFYVDRYSRVDMPPVVELRRASDQKVVMELERGDITDLLATGWKAPEVFKAKGRDGTTDIWGIIIRPTNFDPAKKYPVIENIYAGPQGSFVPKEFGTQAGMQTLAELGFIVVQIDGMGTANRSKAFHDYASKNIGDAGFPDRILWHKAVGAKYPYYDITRVGIYGTSAGGQNSTGAVLFHPEFYKAAASSAGCHDNRMDKIWWNEQWMGWPIGPEYAASSNTEHAENLQGALLLIVGEMDNNVDPSSTMQVVNKLILANKGFDLLVIPNALHTNGGAYGDHKRFDFFVQHLQGRMPPPWNSQPSMNLGTAGVSVLDADAIEWEKTEDLGFTHESGT